MENWSISVYQGLNSSLEEHDLLPVVARFFIIAMACVVIILTIFGNMLVIVAVLNKKQLRKVGNAYIVSLAVSDVLVGTLVSPLALMYQLDGKWTLGETVCDMWVSLDVICCTASIVNLCVISFDRYNAIAQPLKYSVRRTPKRACFFILCIWTYSAIIALPPFAGWRENGFNDGLNDSSASRNDCSVYKGAGYTLFSTIGAFYMPLIVMAALYCKIYTATRVRCKLWISAPGYRQAVLSNRSSFVQKQPRFAIDEQLKRMDVPDKVFPYQINPIIGSRLCRQNDTRVYQRSGSLHILVSKKCPDNEDVVPALPHRPSTASSRRSMLSRMLSYQSSSGMATTETILSGGTGDTTLEHPDTLHSVERPLQQQISLKPTDTSAIIALCRSLSPLFGGITDDSTEENETTEATARNNASVRATSTLDKTKRTKKRRNKISLAQERRAARTLGIIMGCFVVCWLPFFVVTLLNSFAFGVVPIYVNEIVLWLGYLNSALNPAIYTFFNRDFRRAFRGVLCCTK